MPSFLTHSLVICGTALAVLTAPVQAQQAPGRPPQPDPARGQALAERLCSNCHEVGPGQSANAKVEPPSFRAIARRPGQTAEGLAGKIIVPHPEMPAVPVTLPEIRDLVVYILSLKE